MSINALTLVIHVLAVVIWVGGMFFAYMALRPAALTLEPGERLPLWSRSFARFFPWVWAAVTLILATGLWMMAQGKLGLYVHIMFGLGLVMMAIFAHVFFAPYRRLKAAVAAEDWPEGGKRLAQIRQLVGINTLIGVIVIATGAGGRYLLP